MNWRRLIPFVALATLFAATLGPSIRFGGSTAIADVTSLQRPVVATTHQSIVYRGLGASTVRPRMLFTRGDTAWAKIVVAGMDDGDWVISALYHNTMRQRLNDSTYVSFYSDITDSVFVGADTLQIHVATDSGTVILMIHDNSF